MRHAKSVAAARYEDWLERRMEQRLGIDTAGIDHDLAGLGVPPADLVHAYAYEPVQLRVFARIIRAAAIEPANYVMVDFGSGKGRALILGAECGFGRLVGGERAPASRAEEGTPELPSLTDLAPRLLVEIETRLLLRA